MNHNMFCHSLLLTQAESYCKIKIKVSHDEGSTSFFSISFGVCIEERRLRKLSRNAKHHARVAERVQSFFVVSHESCVARASQVSRLGRRNIDVSRVSVVATSLLFHQRRPIRQKAQKESRPSTTHSIPSSCAHKEQSEKLSLQPLISGIFL